MRVAFRTDRRTMPRVIRRRANDDSLVIKGGLIIGPSGASSRLDILIEALRVEGLAPSIEAGAGAIDATGLVVFPGLVHPWFDLTPTETPPSSFVLAEELRAAMHFGITTVHMPNVNENQGHALRQAIAEEIFDGPRVLLSKSVDDQHAIESPLTALRRSIGYGVDLVLTEGLVPELEQIARSVAEMARRPLIKVSALHSCLAPSSTLFERLFAEGSSVRIWETVAQESLASANALGMGETIGSIEVGKLADMTIIEADAGSWRPTMVLSASSG